MHGKCIEISCLYFVACLKKVNKNEFSKYMRNVIEYIHAFWTIQEVYEYSKQRIIEISTKFLRNVKSVHLYFLMLREAFLL